MADKNEIEAAIAIAEAETGVQGGNRSIPLCRAPVKTRARIWTEQEDQFLRANHGRLSEKTIAHRLGRTPTAIHIRRERELHLISPSKDPKILTGEHIAIGLGCDGKTIHLLMDTGRMPGRRLPTAGRTIRIVDRMAFMKWLLNPENFLYFKPDRVGALRNRGKRPLSECYDFAFWDKARQLVLKARKKWKDEWLTPGQVVHVLKIEVKSYPGRPRKFKNKIPGVRYVNLAIRKGNLKATRWGNWWIRKSDLPQRGKTFNFRGDIVDQANPSVRKYREYDPEDDKDIVSARNYLSIPYIKRRFNYRQVNKMRSIKRVRVEKLTGRQRKEIINLINCVRKTKNPKEVRTMFKRLKNKRGVFFIDDAIAVTMAAMVALALVAAAYDAVTDPNKKYPSFADAEIGGFVDEFRTMERFDTKEEYEAILLVKADSGTDVRSQLALIEQPKVVLSGQSWDLVEAPRETPWYKSRHLRP